MLKGCLVLTKCGIVIMAKHLHLGFMCQKEIVPEVLWFAQMQLCQLLLLEKMSFLLATLLKKLKKKELYFSNDTVMKFNI